MLLAGAELEMWIKLNPMPQAEDSSDLKVAAYSNFVDLSNEEGEEASGAQCGLGYRDMAWLEVCGWDIRVRMGVRSDWVCG